MTDDARLVLAVLRDAVAAGAQVANRLPVVDLIWEGGRVDGVVAACQVSDDRVEIRADAVVNATGPWVERLARFEEESTADRLHPSKGVHVVVDTARLPVQNLVIMGTSDKRSIFVLPRGDIVAIGTTDTSYHGDQLLWPEIERADVEYLLDPLGRYFDVKPLGVGRRGGGLVGRAPPSGPKGQRGCRDIPQRRGVGGNRGDDNHCGRQAHRLSRHGNDGARRCGRAAGPDAGAEPGA